MVTETTVKRAFTDLGIVPGDIVLVHSSLRSLGMLNNGPDTVIRGIEAVIGKEGTLVMPTLSQVDFNNSYKTWYMDKPSDVGYLTEYFRKQPYVYRSNQETHSVAARGKYAYTLTFEHKASGPHLCPFGEYAFSDSSPWMKMYQMGAKTVFIGVSTRYNTVKHMVEARFAEHILAQVADPGQYAQLRSEVATFGHFTGAEIWPMYNGTLMEEEYEKRGLIRRSYCGNALLLCIDMKATCDAAFEILCENPARWCNAATMDWIRRCNAAGHTAQH